IAPVEKEAAEVVVDLVQLNRLCGNLRLDGQDARQVVLERLRIVLDILHLAVGVSGPRRARHAGQRRRRLVNGIGAVRQRDCQLTAPRLATEEKAVQTWRDGEERVSE